jgi:uncharacterized membrane protein YfcA
MELLAGILIIFTAYFLKGFSGFGPSLILVPSLSLVYDPVTAITAAALFDFVAGGILLITVRKEIHWRFVLSIFLALALGAILGSLLLGTIDTTLIKKIIALAILLFSGVILFQHNNLSHAGHHKSIPKLKYPVGFISGVLGGLISITGPTLIIYMKMLYKKEFFRIQLIGIFFLGSGWRFLLYRLNQLPIHITLSELMIYFAIMLIGLWVGSKLHVKVNENIFNKVVALLIIIPAVNLLLS